MTDFPRDQLRRVIELLPRAAQLRLRLASREFLKIVSETFTAITWDSMSAPIGTKHLAERFCNLSRLAIRGPAIDKAQLVATMDGCTAQRLKDLSLTFSNRSKEETDYSADMLGDKSILATIHSHCCNLTVLSLALDFRHRTSSVMEGTALLGLITQQPSCLERLSSLQLALPYRWHPLLPHDPRHDALLQPCWNHLTRLTSLQLQPVHLESLVQLSRLSALQRLSVTPLSLEQMAVQLPQACSGLQHLTSLALNVANVSVDHGLLPVNDLGHLTQLAQLHVFCAPAQDLAFTGLKLHDYLLSVVTQLPRLVELSMEADELDREQAAMLRTLSQLTQLRVVYYESLEGQHSQMTGLRALQLDGPRDGPYRLYAGFTDLDDLVPQKLTLLSSLQLRKMWEDLPTLLQHVSQHTALVQLHLNSLFRDPPCRRPQLAALAALPALQDLKLDRVLVGGNDPSLPRFSRLKRIACVLSDMEPAWLVAVTRSFSNATHLSFVLSVPDCNSTAIMEAFQQFNHAQVIELGPAQEPDHLLATLRGLATGPSAVSVTDVSLSVDRGSWDSDLSICQQLLQLRHLAFRGGCESFAQSLVGPARALLPLVRVEALPLKDWHDWLDVDLDWDEGCV